MARSLRGRTTEHEEAQGCPVCLEPLTEDQFRFPCGHGVCNGCNARLEQRDFLSCPTCRTPREGVSQRQVDRANRARARSDNEDEHQLVVFAGGREYEVLFFPDESDGQHPFGSLQGPPFTLHEVGRTVHEFSAAADQATQEEAIRAAEAAIEAEVEFHSEGTRVPLSRRPSVTLRGPMRDLMDSLLRPTTVAEFLAQRESVRNEAQRVARATPPPRPRRATNAAR